MAMRPQWPCASPGRGKLDEEVAIASTPSSVRLVSSPYIDWVDGIEIVLGLLRGVQIYEPNEVRIETSRSGDHKRQKTEITRKKIVEVAMFCDLVARRLLNRAISIFEADTGHHRLFFFRDKCIDDSHPIFFVSRLPPDSFDFF